MMTLTQTERNSIIRKMADLEPGWASIAEVMMTIEPDDADARRSVRQAVGDLVRFDQIQFMHVKHRSQPMLCLYIEPYALLQMIAS